MKNPLAICLLAILIMLMLLVDMNIPVDFLEALGWNWLK